MSKKEQFIKKWIFGYSSPGEGSDYEDELNEVIVEAIAEHEAWKLYPENVPKDGIYLCQLDNNHDLTHFEVLSFSNKVHEWRDINYQEWLIIAFRNLPAPYREKGGNNG